MGVGSESQHRYDRCKRAVVQRLPQGRARGGGPMRYALLIALAVAAVLGGCHEKDESTAPPPPLRPDPVPKDNVVVAKDCEPTEPAAEPKSMPFDERSIPEG